LIHWIHVILPLAASVTFLPAAATHDISARIALLPDCEIASARLSLADLLPASAPAEIRDAASQVSLGAAPLPGAVRVFSSSLILSRISQKELAALLEIPDRVVVRRASRPLTSQEVFDTVQRVLVANHFPLASTIQPADLRMAAPVLVAQGQINLRVTRIEFDSGLGRLRLLIVPESGQGSLPFVATLSLREKPAKDVIEKFDPAAGEIASNAEKNPDFPSEPASSSSEKPKSPNLRGVPPLVVPGRPALLRILSADMRMVLTVLPLENGGLGQEIRVRVPETGRIVRARVAGEGYLEASL
jgi:hypothetical protein